MTTKTVAPKKRAAAKKTPAKVAPKKTVAKKAVKTVVKPAPAKKKSTGEGRNFNPKTGFVKGTQQDIIATELLKGGTSRREIVDRLKPLLPSETRGGQPKPVGNLVAGVWGTLKSRGFVEKSSYKVVAPSKS